MPPCMAEIRGHLVLCKPCFSAPNANSVRKLSHNGSCNGKAGAWLTVCTFVLTVLLIDVQLQVQLPRHRSIWGYRPTIPAIGDIPNEAG